MGGLILSRLTFSFYLSEKRYIKQQSQWRPSKRRCKCLNLIRETRLIALNKPRLTRRTLKLVLLNWKKNFKMGTRGRRPPKTNSLPLKTDLKKLMKNSLLLKRKPLMLNTKSLKTTKRSVKWKKNLTPLKKNSTSPSKNSKMLKKLLMNPNVAVKSLNPVLPRTKNALKPKKLNFVKLKP